MLDADSQILSLVTQVFNMLRKSQRLSWDNIFAAFDQILLTYLPKKCA